ncbi:MAG: DUF2273 domain-containing protein [Oscillospiraceae bacterium]
MKKQFLEFCQRNLNTIVCTFLGLLAAVLMLTIGFWKTLLLYLLALIGYFIGCWKDGKIDFAKWYNRFRR